MLANDFWRLMCLRLELVGKRDAAEADSRVEIRSRQRRRSVYWPWNPRALIGRGARVGGPVLTCHIWAVTAGSRIRWTEVMCGLWRGPINGTEKRNSVENISPFAEKVFSQFPLFPLPIQRRNRNNSVGKPCSEKSRAFSTGSYNQKQWKNNLLTLLPGLICSFAVKTAYQIENYSWNLIP